MENSNEITDLLYKHIREELSAQESIQLQNWVKECDENQIFFNKATDIKLLLYNARTKTDNLQEIDLDQAWEDLKKMGWEHSAEPAGKLRSINWRRYVVAAAVVLGLIGAYWVFVPSRSQHTSAEKPVVAKVSDVAPGQFKAMLTLEDGRKVVLDTAMQGELARQGNAVVFNKDGKLVYDLSKRTPALKNSFNILSTANGQTYAMTLSDGSKVWLNSASSIKYPVAFIGKERRVEVTGEAYFEITDDPKKPFYVVANGMEVQVLGTNFNINGYADDGRIRVTLLEGKVKVNSAIGNPQSAILKPGEQAIAVASPLTTDHSPLTASLTTDRSPNLEAVMAWKEGRFYFDGATINDVMHQLGRWYNLEVSNEVKNSDIRLGGELSRNKKLSEILAALELSDVHFRVEGRKLILIQ